MLRFVFILILTLGVLSCEKEDVIETDAELLPYFEIFVQEAAKRGITVDYIDARIEGHIQDIPSPNVQGQCFYNEKKPNKVIVDLVYWSAADENTRQFIIFHELGHCFLKRDHLDTSNSDGTCVSIMHSSGDVCTFSLTDDNREAYLDELFGL